MKELKCPHCGKAGITPIRKMFLGPAVPATCKTCGRKVGVPYTSILTVIPFFAAVLFAHFAIEPFWLKAVVWAGGFTAMSVAHIRWVPLEQR
jgi:hypothetical protein